MSDLARGILETVFCFSRSKGNITHDTIDMQDGVPIHIKDITVTPSTNRGRTSRRNNTKDQEL